MISSDEFVDRLCRLAADRGPRPFPRHGRDREILMKSIVLGLDSARRYSEREINTALRAWSRHVAPAIETDHVTLRRLLVDHGRLERSPDGAVYRVAFPPNAVAFELAVEALDLRAIVSAYREAAEEKRKRAAKERGARRH